MAHTDIKDRYKAWRSDPATPPQPTLAAAFAEGFMQAVETLTGVVRAVDSISPSELTADWDS